jgi:hypothetical protein
VEITSPSVAVPEQRTINITPSIIKKHTMPSHMVGTLSPPSPLSPSPCPSSFNPRCCIPQGIDSCIIQRLCQAREFCRQGTNLWRNTKGFGVESPSWTRTLEPSLLNTQVYCGIVCPSSKRFYIYTKKVQYYHGL